MRKRILLAVCGLCIGVPFASAKPPVASADLKAERTPAAETVVWLPGTNAPRDIEGNSAVANAPRRGEAQNDNSDAVGGLRGMPNWVAFGPSGADAPSIAASPTTPGLVIAGLASSVGGGAIYRSTDGGSSWTATNGTGTRAVAEVEFDSNGVAWAATGDGLFQSTDGGENWVEVFLPIAGQALVEDVAIDPTNASVLWVGLGQFLNGTSTQVVFRSDDGGLSWSDVSPPVGFGLGATVVAIDPANTQRVYTAFTGNFGAGRELWVTVDGGQNWMERSSGLPNAMINDIAFASGQAYVAGGQDFGSQFLGFYTTSDDGQNWTDLGGSWPSRATTSIAIDPANSSNILVGSTRAGVARTTDGGATWTFSAGGTGAYQVNGIEYVPGSSSEIFLGMGSVAVFRSSDGGETFTPSANGMSRLEITSFAVNPLNPNEIAASYISQNVGGINITTDGGATWTASEAPLPRWQKVYFGPDGTLYGTHDGPLGRADDGLWRRNADGSWSNMGPGSPTSLDTIGYDIAATTGENPVILWGGNRWLGSWAAQVWSYNRAGTGEWDLEYEGIYASEQVNSLVWLNNGAGPEAVAAVVNFGSDGAGGILRTGDMGDTWTPSEFGYIPGWSAWELAPGPQDGNTVYVNASANPGAGTGAIFKSIDAGLTWTQQGGNPASRVFAVDQGIPGTIFIHPTWTSTGPERSTDDGLSFELYANGYLGGGSRDLVYGGTVAGARRLYVATHIGGYMTELPPAGNECPADWDGDDAVNSGDISAFLTSWIASVQAGDLVADFNGDGQTNSGDISSFLTAWIDAVSNGC